jgi:carboxylesterase type B
MLNRVRDASTAGPACMQLDAQHQNIIGSEDYLKLDIWTPTAIAASHLPVMVFIHDQAGVNPTR